MPRKSKFKSKRQLLFRGARTPDLMRTKTGLLSFTDCLPVAVVYSSFPSRDNVRFVEGSTVGAASIDMSKTLDLLGYDDEPFISLNQVLTELNYGKDGGISDAEVEKILNYLANRDIGKLSATLPSIKYKFYADSEREEERDVLREAGLTRSFFGVLRDEFANSEWFYSDDDDETVFDWASRILVDSFAFADAPAVQREAVRQEFTAIEYQDAFEGGERAFRDLAGIEDPDIIECVETAFSVESEWDNILTHRTVRPTNLDHIAWEWQAPAQAVLDEMVIHALSENVR